MCIENGISLILCKGVNIMATSTFDKQFVVKKDRSSNFVKEMSKTAAPTLKKSFQSHLVHEKDLREQLEKALK